MMGYAPITTTRVFNVMTKPKREVDRILWVVALAPLFAMVITGLTIAAVYLALTGRMDLP